MPAFEAPDSSGFGTWRVDPATGQVFHNPSNPGGWPVGVSTGNGVAVVRDATGAVAFSALSVDVTRVAAASFEVIGATGAYASWANSLDIPIPDALAGDTIIVLARGSLNHWLTGSPPGISFTQVADNRMGSSWRRCFVATNISAPISGEAVTFTQVDGTQQFNGLAMVVRSPATWVSPLSGLNSSLTLEGLSGRPAGSLAIGQWSYGGTASVTLNDPEGIFGTAPSPAAYRQGTASTSTGLALAVWEHDGRPTSYQPSLSPGFGRTAVTIYSPA